MAVRPPGKERFVRIRSLGESYAEEALKRRVLARNKPEPLPRSKLPVIKRIRYRGVFCKTPRLFALTFPRTIKGFRALYLHYLHILRAARSPHSRGAAFLFREDLRYARQLSEQARLLCVNEIDTAEELADYRAGLTEEIKELTESRDALTAGRRKADTPEQLALLNETAGRLRKLRKEVRLCDAILVRSEDIQKKMKAVREKPEKKEPDKMLRQR